MDSLQAVAPGEHTFPVTSKLLSGAIAVDDAEVTNAMAVAFETLQLVLEPVRMRCPTHPLHNVPSPPTQPPTLSPGHPLPNRPPALGLSAPPLGHPALS